MRGRWWLGLLLTILIVGGCATQSQITSSPATPRAESKEAQRLLAVGLKRFRHNDVAGAMADFTKAVELEPQMGLAYYSRAKARTAQGDQAGAMADFTKAVELEPKLVNGYYLRGLLRAQQNDVAGAMADFTKAVLLDPDDALAFSQRGLLRAQQGDRPGAIQDLRQALELGISTQDQAVIRNTLQELER